MRYFGGTKLGTGGLVRAYGAAVRQALEELATEERVLHYVAHIVVDYALYAKLEYLLPQHQVRILGQEFQNAVALDIAVPHDVKQTVADLLQELSNGQICLEQSDERYL